MEDMVHEATLKLAKQQAQIIDNMEFNKTYVVKKLYADNKMWIEATLID